MNQVTLLAKLTCLAGKRSELGHTMILLPYPFFKRIISQVKGFASSSESHPLALLECLLFWYLGILREFSLDFGF